MMSATYSLSASAATTSRPAWSDEDVKRGRVQSLGVFDLDRLSSLTIGRREIGKQKGDGMMMDRGKTVPPATGVEVYYEGS